MAPKVTLSSRQPFLFALPISKTLTAPKRRRTTGWYEQPVSCGRKQYIVGSTATARQPMMGYTRYVNLFHSAPRTSCLKLNAGCGPNWEGPPGSSRSTAARQSHCAWDIDNRPILISSLGPHSSRSSPLKKIPYLKDAVVRQSSPNTLTTTIDRGGPVQVSFFGGLNLGQVEAPDFIKDPNLAIASLLDLAGTKAKVIIQRVEPKDYIDIHALLIKGGIPLAKMLAAASVIFGPQINPLDALKAIAYHQDPAFPASPTRSKPILFGPCRPPIPRTFPA